LIEKAVIGRGDDRSLGVLAGGDFGDPPDPVAELIEGAQTLSNGLADAIDINIRRLGSVGTRIASDSSPASTLELPGSAVGVGSASSCWRAVRVVCTETWSPVAPESWARASGAIDRLMSAIKAKMML